MTARDFVFTFQTLVAGKLPLGSGVVEDATYREKIRRVRALDEKRFRVVFRSRYAAWRDLFHFVFPRHALIGEDIAAAWRNEIVNPKTGRPIGSGPFLTERLDAGRQLVLVRNPRYWGPHKAYLDRIVFRFLPSGAASRIEALRSGAVHVAAANATPEFAQFKSESRFRVLVSTGTVYEHLTVRVRGGHPALENRLVRQALAYGIDRAELARRSAEPLLGGLRPLQSAIFMPTHPFHEPTWQRYTHRPAEARRLLERARCRLGSDGIYECGSKRLQLRLVTSAGNERRELVAELVQRQLRQVGVEVVPVFAAPATFIRVILPAGDFDLALFGWLSSPDPGGWVPVWSCGADQNFSGYCSRLISARLNESNLVVEPRARALLNRVDAELATAVPIIPLYQTLGLIVANAKLRGIVGNHSNESYLWNTEDWWLER